jgi:hypothetical protein
VSASSHGWSWRVPSCSSPDAEVVLADRTNERAVGRRRGRQRADVRDEQRMSQRSDTPSSCSTGPASSPSARRPATTPPVYGARWTRPAITAPSRRARSDGRYPRGVS